MFANKSVFNFGVPDMRKRHLQPLPIIANYLMKELRHKFRRSLRLEESEISEKKLYAVAVATKKVNDSLLQEIRRQISWIDVDKTSGRGKEACVCV